MTDDQIAEELEELKNTDLTSWDLMSLAFDLTSELMDAEGVVDDALDARIDLWCQATMNKMDHHSYMIRDAKAKAAQLKGEAKRLTDAARKCERVVERVRGHAQTVLEGRVELYGWEDGRKRGGDYGQVYLQKRTALKIDDDEALIAVLGDGSDFVRVKLSVDRTAVSNALKGKGSALPGDAAEMVQLVDSTSVVFK